MRVFTKCSTKYLVWFPIKWICIIGWAFIWGYVSAPVRAARALWTLARWVPIVSLLLAILILGGGFASEGHLPEGYVWKLFVGCLMSALAIALCYYTMVDRMRRIVVPLLAAALFTVALLSYFLAPALIGTSGHVWTMTLAAIGLSVLLAYFLLSWIGLAYEQKVFSDAQFQVFCWMISVAGVVIFAKTLVSGGVLTDPRNLRLGVATLVALLAYWALIRFLIKPLPSNKRLLVLRMFAQDSRREGLLEELEYRWRFIGPIVLIGASDFAARTIDPAKAANFLRLKLKEGFIPDRHVLYKRVAAMDDVPDPDGRYRVNEFFCFDDIWKDAVQMLLDSCDAIVLDLRGFTAERKGTAYEIGLLAGHGALGRTVFLVDAETDLEAVQTALKAPLPAGHVIHLESAMGGKMLVESLVRKTRTGSAPVTLSSLPLAPAT